MPPTQPECSPPNAAPQAVWQADCVEHPQSAMPPEGNSGFNSETRIAESDLPEGNSDKNSDAGQ
eukprot:11659414-Alexandrium_andersonii.AAC.1